MGTCSGFEQAPNPLFGKHSSVSDSRQDRPGVVAPPVLIFAGFFAAAWCAHLWLNLSLPLCHGLRQGLAVLLAAAALSLILGATGRFRQAGTNARPWLPSTAVVTTGPYRFTRNPMYLGMVFLYLAGGLLLNSTLHMVFLLPLLVVIQRGVIERNRSGLTVFGG